MYSWKSNSDYMERVYKCNDITDFTSLYMVYLRLDINNNQRNHFYSVPLKYYINSKFVRLIIYFSFSLQFGSWTCWPWCHPTTSTKSSGHNYHQKFTHLYFIVSSHHCFRNIVGFLERGEHIATNATDFENSIFFLLIESVSFCKHFIKQMLLSYSLVLLSMIKRKTSSLTLVQM